MLGKPLSHLRPLLRLQTHAQPDLFTSNPSLLHHFPQQGGHGIVQAGPSSAQAAGQNAGNAGRAGWGGGAGTGGNGYTGHARAFLGLPQTTSVDPSSSLNDDTKDQERAALSHQRRFQAARFAQTQVAGPLEGSEGRRRIEGREGGLLRAIAMEEAAEVRSLDPELAARYISAASASAGELAGRPKRRGSIAYPQARPAITAGEASPRPSGRRELVRSSSSMDVWMGSTVTSRPHLRAYSTRSPSIPLPDLVDEASLDAADITHITPPPSTRSRIISQPNRVLMDLAGRDLPKSSSITRRYNSSLATESPLKIFDDLPLPPLPSAPPKAPQLTPEQQIDRERNTKIYNAIYGKAKNLSESKRGTIAVLIAHYRSSRQLAPLDERKVPGDPSLVDQFPLPSGYDTGTYNACLEGLMALREPGESIAPVLEAYNEMLERDVLPNMRTYQVVIRALCARETDVWQVVGRWQRDKEWAQRKSQDMGREYKATERDTVRDQLIKGYTAEGNLDSALRLFSAAKTFQNNSQWRFPPATYRTILSTIATQLTPNLRGMREVFDHAISRQPRGVMGLYQYVFEALGRAGHVEELGLRWADFRKAEQEGRGTLLSHWSESDLPDDEASEHIRMRIKAARMAAYTVAIRQFARLGELEKAEEILALVEESGEDEGQYFFGHAYGALITGIASRDIDAALAKYAEIEPKIRSVPGGRLPTSDIAQLFDNLAVAGKWRKALEIGQQDPSNTFAPDLVRVQHLYQAIVVEAKRASSLDEAREILSHIPKLLIDRDFSMIAFPVKDHFAVLAQHGLWADAEPALVQFRNSREKVRNWATWFIPFVQSAAPHLDIRQLVELYRAALGAGLNLHTEPAVMDLFADKYVANQAAGSEDGAQAVEGRANMHWDTIMLLVRKLEGERYDEGGMDELLEKITEDLVARLQDTSGGAKNASLRRRILDKIEGHAQILVDRFGEERAKAMLQGVEMPSGFVWNPEAQPSSEADVSTSTPPPSVSEFSVPSPHTSATSVSTPPPPSGPQYTISRDLSVSVDTHCTRNARMTADGAYNMTYEQLEKSSLVPHPYSIARMINSLGREGADDKVSNLYALAQAILQQGGAEPHQLAKQWCDIETNMIIASCHLGHLERAGAHRQRIIDAGMVPSADAYATMIASSKDTTDDALVARALFDESQRLGVIPNLYLYNTIISKLSRARKAELSLELFAHMKAAGIEPSSVTYGAVINACCRVGDAQSAETLFNEMRSHRAFKPRVPPYNTMMQFFNNNSPSRAKVLHYYSLLRQDNVPPSAHTYKLLMDAYSTLPPIDLVAMERVYSDLLADRKVQPQGTHTASRITAYGIYGDDLAKAMEIFESSPIYSQRGTDQTHDAIVWEAILNVVAHRGTVADLEAMRQRMVASGIRATAYVYNVLIAGYARARQIEDARRIFDSMGDSVTGVAAPNNHPILLTGSGYAKPQTTTEQPTDMVYREPSTYEAMVRAEMLAGDVARAQEVLARMEARGYPFAVFMRVKAVIEDASFAGLQGQHMPSSSA